jgi:hypothetical protein
MSNMRSCPVNGHDLGVSGPYFRSAQVLLVTAALQISRLDASLNPPFVQLLAVCVMRQHGQEQPCSLVVLRHMLWHTMLTLAPVCCCRHWSSAAVALEVTCDSALQQKDWLIVLGHFNPGNRAAELTWSKTGAASKPEGPHVVL